MINKGCEGLQSNSLNLLQLIPELLGEFVPLFGANDIMSEIEKKIEPLWKEGLDRSFDDSKGGTCQYFLSEALEKFVEQNKSPEK